MQPCCRVVMLGCPETLAAMQVVLEEEAEERARKDFRKDWLWHGGTLFQEPLTLKKQQQDTFFNSMSFY